MKLHLILAATCAIALGGVSNEADAWTVPAMAGHGWPNHFDGCFGSSWQLMQNNCGGTPGTQRLLIIPAQSAEWGYNYVSVRAAGNGFDTGTMCSGLAVDVFSGSMQGYFFTPIISTTTSNQIQSLSLGRLFTLPTSTMHFECSVAHSGGRVFSAYFTN